MNLETKIALLAPTLFTILFGLIFLNLLIYLAHLKSNPTTITKQMCSFWAVQLGIFLIVPFFDEGNLQLAIPYSLNFVTIYITYKALFANLVPIAKFKNFVYIFGLGWVIAVANEIAFQNFTLTTLPIAFAISLPLAYLLRLIAFSKISEFKTIHHKLIFFIFLVTIVHNFNFSFFRVDPTNYLWGMTLHIFLVVAFSISLSNFHIYLVEKDEKKRLSNLVKLKTKALNRKYLQLKMMSEERANLFRIVIHDLSNPVTTIVNFLSYLRKPEISNEQRQKVATQAYEVSNGLVSIINQVRTLEGIKTGKIDISKELINLAETFNIVDMIFRPQYDSKGVILEIDSPSEDILFHGNKDLFIHTVLSNLLSNSLKFSTSGSTVRLTYQLLGSKLQVQVIDKGRGIQRERLSYLFNMNTPTSSQGTEGETGTGFGMPLVKSYVDEVEGSISITSKTQDEDKDEHGTKVELLFELYKQDTRSDSSPSLRH